MPFNAIRENKILAKISEFTVVIIGSIHSTEIVLILLNTVLPTICMPFWCFQWKDKRKVGWMGGHVIAFCPFNVFKVGGIKVEKMTTKTQ